jgi:hypothetical protein
METRQSLSSFYLIGDGKGYDDGAFVAFGISQSLAGVMQIRWGTGGSCECQMAGWRCSFAAFGLPTGANLFQHDYALYCVRLREGASKQLIQWNLQFGPSSALFMLHP